MSLNQYCKSENYATTLHIYKDRYNRKIEKKIWCFVKKKYIFQSAKEIFGKFNTLIQNPVKKYKEIKRSGVSSAKEIVEIKFKQKKKLTIL